MHFKITQICLAILVVFSSMSYAAVAPASVTDISAKPPVTTAPVVALKVTCTPLKVKAANKNIFLTSSATQPASAQLYFLKNVSKKSLWLDHPTKRAAASAGWSSYLRPGQWSAIVMDKKDFALSCAVIAPGQVEYLDCATAIAVCIPQHLVVTSMRKGTYWFVEDKSWEELLKGVAKRGVKQ